MVTTGVIIAKTGILALVAGLTLILLNGIPPIWDCHNYWMNFVGLGIVIWGIFSLAMGAAIALFGSRKEPPSPDSKSKP